MRNLHAIHLGNPDTTDVVTFPLPPVDCRDGLWTGDIYINVEQAVELTSQAIPPWPAASRELALYLAHACDHLAGETDHTTAERKRMRRRELRWLKELTTAEDLNQLVLGPGTC
jgi:rRNA maturation RNase YbeY